jgi:hypothetical protein
MNPAVDDGTAYGKYLVTQCEAFGCPKRDFMAKKGDVLFWAADLVHGSNPRTRPVTETRMSLVTHYVPSGTAPYWFRFLPDHHGRETHHGIDYVSQHYVLPGAGMRRPRAAGSPAGLQADHL